MQPLSRNQRPDFLTSLMNISFVLRLPRDMHLCRSSSNVPRLPSFLDMLQNPHFLLTFEKVHNPLRLPRETTSERPKVVRAPGGFLYILTSKCASPTTTCTFSTSQLPKVVRSWCVLYILTSECASRHNRVHFFDISTFKSGPRMVCFVHFDFEICFAPQPRVIFHLSSGQISEPTLRPSGAINHWKNTVFRDFATFLPFRASASSFFWLFLFWSSLF